MKITGQTTHAQHLRRKPKQSRTTYLLLPRQQQANMDGLFRSLRQTNSFWERFTGPIQKEHRRCDHIIKLVRAFNAILHDIFVRTQLIQSGSTVTTLYTWLSNVSVQGCIKQSSPWVSSECVIGYFNPWLGQWSIDYPYTCRWSASTLDSRNRIQEDLAQLEQWYEIKRMQFNKDEQEVLCSGSNNQLHKYKTWNE